MHKATLIFKVLGTVGKNLRLSLPRGSFRNAINAGLPLPHCPGATDLVEDGDDLQVDFKMGSSLIFQKNLKIFLDHLMKNCKLDWKLEIGKLIFLYDYHQNSEFSSSFVIILKNTTSPICQQKVITFFC